MIRKKGGKYCLYSKKTGRNLGCSRTKAGARQREREVQYFVHNKRRDVRVRQHRRRREDDNIYQRDPDRVPRVRRVLWIRSTMMDADVAIVGGRTAEVRREGDDWRWSVMEYPKDPYTPPETLATGTAPTRAEAKRIAAEQATNLSLGIGT